MHEEAARPARPHHRLTDDGRRMREVLTYSRRGSRFTPRQAEAWAAHHDAWVVPDAARDPRTLANPLVAGEFGLQFYAGVALIVVAVFMQPLVGRPREVDPGVERA